MLGEKVRHFSERKTYFFNCVDTSGGYDLQTADRQVDFLVFSGTALSTSRFISSSVTKANRSATLTLILM